MEILRGEAVERTGVAAGSTSPLLGQEGARGERAWSGVFGPLTGATKAARGQQTDRRRHGGTADARHAALQASTSSSPIHSVARRDPTGPPPPAFRPLVSNLERGGLRRLSASSRFPARWHSHPRRLGRAEHRAVTVPQLIRVKDAPSSVAFACIARSPGAGPLQGMGGLLACAIASSPGAAGSCPAASAATGPPCPNHAWGTAFDVNVPWNARGMPALRGEKDSVRELVPIANSRGFWGGHFSRRDGMHFEASRLLG